MSARRSQSGMTLVVSMIMLIVLTLLVVSAIRFGNINLKISGNAQTQAEAAAAAQVAVEQVISAAAGGANLKAMSAASSSISTGGATYTVSVSKPACKLSSDVPTSDLDPTNAKDQLCLNGADGGDQQKKGSGGVTTASAACKYQNWDLAASVNDASSSGTAVTIQQGAALRVTSNVGC